jgi:small subunit ribosomal protein S17
MMPDKAEKPAAKTRVPRKAAPEGAGAVAAAAPKPAKKKSQSPAAGAQAPAAAGQEAGGAGPAARRPNRQQVKVGRVVSNKMAETVIVAVENTVTHRLYHRYMKRTSKFAAHDADNRCQVGDQVAIVSSRPLSKTKRWRVREVLKRAD